MKIAWYPRGISNEIKEKGVIRGNHPYYIIYDVCHGSPEVAATPFWPTLEQPLHNERPLDRSMRVKLLKLSPLCGKDKESNSTH